ncbi:MAG: GH3 auxin-responsive promoter family protein [Saprospiraceae bacterium]|nr:GH3 auxin-responsive promoter family protein [Saprospiraceae bacterium]MBK7810190.1 GH3 auxin-responsive promoter family protein [Saprospiraceae bacterium]MBK9629794.1 GH3 auxin-responsive promoter family protein [Saprospiraceae bacterium]
MVNTLVNLVWKTLLKVHENQINAFISDPHGTQKRELSKILTKASNTEWGQRYQFSKINSDKLLAKHIPIFEYDQIKDDIFRMMEGEKDVLWPGRVYRFAKSSGTTSDKSKYIPVTEDNHRYCHSKGGFRLLSRMYSNIKNPNFVEGKSIVLAGSLRNDLPEFPGSTVGDVSAVIMSKLSPIALGFISPDLDINLMENFENKLDRIAEICSKQDIRMVAGTPTWAMVLFNKILDLTGKSNINEVWPNFQVFVHGAVSFVPYRKPFQKYFPSPDTYYMETYNASEGYFGVQDSLDEQDMLLLLDNGVFYEFLPMSEWDSANPIAIGLEEVELGKSYGLIITTNSGLYRYKIGDTVMFTSLNPYKIVITGRIKQFINVFGEEVMVSNTDQALAETCKKWNISVKEYSVAPIFLDTTSKGGHEWVVEFDQEPKDVDKFAEDLDLALQKLNSDYEAKRYKSLALESIKLTTVSSGTFMKWMISKNKVNAQQKVPRLANTRTYIDEILKFS